MKLFRQGDVLLKEIEEIPMDAEKVRSKILVRGEVTGHAHRLRNGQVLKKDNQMFVKLEQETELVHQEHRTILLPKGFYEIIRQREYIAGQKTRLVLD